LNIEEYIATGILEAYVLGELSEAERMQVEKNISMSSELKTELRKVEETLESFARKASIKPRADLKSKVMDKIPVVKPQVKKEAVKKETKIIALAPAANYWKYATAACLAFALLASYLAFNYRSRLQETTVSLNNLIAQNQRMAREYNTVNQKLDKIEQDLSVIENASFTKVVMKGTENEPQALASVYWNASTKEVFLSVQELKNISKDNQFQLWAIVDGKPVDAGVFDGGFTGLLKMKNIVGATAFAVTVEPYGGKASPSLETMRVFGSINTPKS
jgi:anti-sigma-K factor RskA